MPWTTISLFSYLTLWVLVILEGCLILALARMLGQLNRRLPPSGARVIDPGPDLGELVEGWEGVDLLGKRVAFSFPRDRGIFLLYISPHCSVCAGLLPSARRFFKEINVEADAVWVMVLGSRDTQIAYAKQEALMHDPVLAEEQLPASWRLEGAPFGVWIDRQGKVQAKGMVDRREHLESLRDAARVGQPSVEAYLSLRTEEEERFREDSR